VYARAPMLLGRHVPVWAGLQGHVQLSLHREIVLGVPGISKPIRLYPIAVSPLRVLS
jgi:hypothetical protein